MKSLLPVTKTGRPRKVDDDDRIKVLASKLTILTEDDCVSTGAMARGHLLEPYAVEAFNIVMRASGASSAYTFTHWDDTLVTGRDPILAFSPDAMNVTKEQFDQGVRPSAILEVKSYSPSAHLAMLNMPKDLVDERWQIAVAMAVLDSINEAWLVFFNPKLSEHKLILVYYDREDLRDEIGKVIKVAEEWEEFINKYEGSRHIRSFFCVMNEKEIEQDVELLQHEEERRNVLNPQ